MKVKYAFILLIIGAILCLSLKTPNIYAQDKQSAQIKSLFEHKCSKCHSLSIPLSKKEDLQWWKKTTLRMSQKDDSNISPAQAEKIAEYLSKVAGK